MSKLSGLLITLLTFLGMPLFAVMGGISLLSWSNSKNEGVSSFIYIAPNVVADAFVASPILVTIPLFTFAGYLMAESKTPDRLVRVSRAALGWMPGGLAIVCILANAFFTTMTGGSGVTIVAIGGLLYPALIRQGYPQKYALGLVTAAGSVGLLFFPSPLVMIYAFISGVDINKAYLATFVPGVVLMLVLVGHAVWVGYKAKVPRDAFDLGGTLRGAWEVKWELMAPLLVGVWMGTGLMGIDEAAAGAALYVLLVEVYIYKDLTWKDVTRIAREAISLSGAILLILIMATALTNYVVDAQIPKHILDWFVENGMDKMWKFLIVLNLFLFILGVVMDEFSAMLVALPLVVPLAAQFGVSPFHLAVMFLLNIEIAYISPPIGINLYIASFRFNKPIAEVYRVVMPFVWLLTAGMLLFVIVPRLSTFTVEKDIVKARAEAEAKGIAPRDAWRLECVQSDQNNPRPCRADDKEKWGEDGQKIHVAPNPNGTAEVNPFEVTEEKKKELDDLEKMMMEAGGDSTASSSSSTGGGGAPSEEKKEPTEEKKEENK